jgi:CSLREA domain-containing protein
LILALVFLPASPFATTFPVTKTADTDDGTCDPDCSLREAIDAANTNPGADDVPVPAGTYLLILGPLAVTDDLSIAGAGQTNTIIDGNAMGRVFDIDSTSGVVEISGVTIRNGNTGVGGGILNYADLTLTNSTVSDNTGTYGGGIRNLYGGDLTLINSTVSGNTAMVGSGGGISNLYGGTLTLTNSTVSGNSAYGRGGGISNYYGGDVTLTNSTVSGNTSADAGGGGIYHANYDGNLTLTNSTVSGNSADAGGGIYSIGILTLTNSTVSHNKADDGGGGILANRTLTLTDSTVSHNDAAYSGYYGSGGGIKSYGTLTLVNSTVSGNSAQWGGGIYAGYNSSLTNSTVSDNTAMYMKGGAGFVSGSKTAIPIFSNTIVAGNDPSTPTCFIGAVDSLGYNLTDDDSCGFTAPSDLVVVDAMLGPLQDNGGPTETHDLLPGSPAIDAGSVDCPPPDTDQRGVARPRGAACDIGAVEYLPEPRGALVLIAGAGFLGLLYWRRARGFRLG